MKSKFISIFSVVFVLISSCKTNINSISEVQTLIQSSQKSFKFKLKNYNKIEETDPGITYQGGWIRKTDSDTSGGSYDLSVQSVENTDPALKFTPGKWSTVQEPLSSNGNYSYNNGVAALATEDQIINGLPPEIIYLKGNSSWLHLYPGHISSKSYNYGQPLIIDNKNTSPDFNLLYNYTLGGIQFSSPWSNSMAGGWVSFAYDTYNYNSNINSTNSIQFQFKGTNVELYGRKLSKSGKLKVSVFQESNPGIFSTIPEKVVDNIDMYNPTDQSSVITKIQGLKAGNHRVIIESSGTTSSPYKTFLYDFDYAKIYPSIQYNFTGQNIRYIAWKCNQYGKVDISVDGGPAERFDLYSPVLSTSPVSELVKEYTRLGTGNHRITIEGTKDKNPLSGNYVISLDKFEAYPGISGNFSGNDITFNLLQSPSSGLTDVYIDGAFNQTIDLYNSLISPVSIPLSGLPDGTHDFNLIATNSKNINSSDYGISLDNYQYSSHSSVLSYNSSSGFDLTAMKDSNQGISDVYVDGSLYGSYDLYSPVTLKQQPITTINSLVPGNHLIEIKSSGKKNPLSGNYLINFDAFAFDTTRIVFSSRRDGNAEIYSMNAYGYDLRRLTNNNYDDIYPSWSQDGSKISFISNRDGNNSIYIMDADGSNLLKLTTNTSSDYFPPRWSPDGTRIIFTSTRDFGTLRNEISMVNSDGTNFVNLSNNPFDDIGPSWSPDGSRIAFSSKRDGNYQIYTMNPDGTNQTRLTINTFADTFPVWSPDGSKLIFRSNRDGNSELYIMNSDGSNQLNLTNNPFEDFQGCWSHDGSKIFFFSDRDGNEEIYSMYPDGTSKTRLTNEPSLDFYPDAY